MPESMQLTVNGTSRSFDACRTIADLLVELDLNPQQVAVEVNRDLIPRELHSQHSLAQGDAVEVVTLVGGG